MQPDPIGYGDGLNLYRYAGNAPLDFNDPTGTAKAKTFEGYANHSAFEDAIPHVIKHMMMIEVAATLGLGLYGAAIGGSVATIGVSATTRKALSSEIGGAAVKTSMKDVSNITPTFVGAKNGGLFVVPKGAKPNLQPSVNEAGKVTGQAYVGGKIAGKEVNLRFMNPGEQGYKNGYAAYSNTAKPKAQNVNPVNGQTGNKFGMGAPDRKTGGIDKKGPHFPLDPF